MGCQNRGPFSALLALALLSVALVLPAASTKAANQFFMPGDAFFHSRLTEKELARIEKEEHPIFHYDRPEFLPRMLCGYAGFSRLRYRSMPPAMKRNLRRAYLELRKSSPKRVEITDEIKTKKTAEGDVDVPTGRKIHREINGPSVFFYNKSFDPAKRRLGLKYNEKWVEHFAAFGHRRDHAILETFVPLAKAVADDWRDSPSVKPLRAVVPELSVKNLRTPIVVQADVVAYVVANPDFKQLYHGKSVISPDGPAMEVYKVTSKGIAKMHSGDGRWRETPPRQPFGDAFKEPR